MNNIIEHVKQDFKKIIIWKIIYLIKQHELFLKTYMNVYKKRFLKTILKLFIEQIHTIQNQNINKITILFNINI